jgi:MoaA/NifB/PqqE/SkfB family radical SAM enzyme
MQGVAGKWGLLRGLLSGEAAYAGPFAVTVDVTRRCNLRCIGCKSHSPHLNPSAQREAAADDLDAGMFADLCRELKTIGTGTLVLCGEGEPMLHPRLFDLIALAKTTGARVVLLTNGSLLDQAKMQALVSSRLDVLRVSLWGSSAEEYANNYPGSNPEYLSRIGARLNEFASIKEGRRSLLPRIAPHLVINRHNCRKIESFVDLAIEARVNAVSFSPLHSIFGGLASIALSKEEERTLKDSLRQAARRLHSCGVDHNVEETIQRYDIGEEVRRKVPCYVAWTHPRIRVDGTVHPCGPCTWAVGSLREQSLREIWNGPGYRSFRKKVLSPSSSSFIDENCDCSYCCHIIDNLRIHRFYKWLTPMGRRKEG